MDPISSRRLYSELFFISFIALFFELTCIRWFASYVVFLTFFTNVVLLASFLGLGVGCLTASRRTDFINWVPPLTYLATICAFATHFLYAFSDRFVVKVEAQEIIYFGTEYRHPDVSTVVIPLEVIAGFFFALIAIIFIGIGQVMGRKLQNVPNRLMGYMINIGGSLLGILVFGLISAFGFSPFCWFAVALGGACYFLSPQRRAMNYGYTVTTILFVGLIGSGLGRSILVRWSPYSQLVYNPAKGSIDSNNIRHQYMIRPSTIGPAYLLPYLLNGVHGQRPVDDVLIIGAGSGNDVSAALWAGARHIDAVEVDPVIYDLGKQFHPDRPYQDPRVHAHIDDGRNFLRRTNKQYDLIVYALVDSLVLHSGYSSIRLESFLFTREAFTDIKSRLKKDGVFVAYNFFRQGWLVNRLVQMAEELFEKKAVVFSFPYLPEINASSTGGLTMIVVGEREGIEKFFAAGPAGWLAQSNPAPASTRWEFDPGFKPASADDFVKIGPAAVRVPENLMLPDDSWPFFYLREPRIPALTLRGMAVMGILSLVLIGMFAPARTVQLNWSMFFLGAGFMLLEAKGVVQMALLFGSTWTVNAIVFAAILVMILFSNSVVLRFKPERLTPYYIALTIFLILNALVDLNAFLGLPPPIRIVGSCALLFLPVFLAGVIFGVNFSRATNPDIALGSNIAGAVLGGLAENFSLILGFRYLMVVAILFYLLAKYFEPRLLLKA